MTLNISMHDAQAIHAHVNQFDAIGGIHRAFATLNLTVTGKDETFEVTMFFDEVERAHRFASAINAADKELA